MLDIGPVHPRKTLLRLAVGAAVGLSVILAPGQAGAGEAEGLAVSSERVVVMDRASGDVLYAKNERTIAGIASTTKIFVALVVRQRGLDLDGTTAITKEDRDYARGGARTRLNVGQSFTNHDLLRAMLIASDNRAPTALGRAVGLSPKQLIAAMNKLARELGLADTAFTDPSGLRGNESSAHDMALAFKAALEDAVLVEIMGTRDATVRATRKKAKPIHYHNTNQPLHGDTYQVFAGKTGYTRKAGYCLLTAARIDGRDVIMVFLGGEKKSTRFRDFYQVAKWLDRGREGPGSVATKPASE